MKVVLAYSGGLDTTVLLTWLQEKYDAEAIPEELRDHALFIAFAPVEEPKIAVAVIIEHGGGGGSVAAPVARAILDAYLQSSPP